MRWPDGVVKCPRCNNDKVYTLRHKPFHWQCRNCQKNGYRFSVITKTIFENTNYPLSTWFEVIYLMSQSKKGMSALQLHRTMGSGSYKTAWYMCHRIRAAMQDKDFPQLMGEVEVDETYVGGKDKNRHRNKKTHQTGGEASGKTAVIGAISRKGNVVCQMIENTRRETLNKFVKEAVSDEVTLLATDEHPAYGNLKPDSGRMLSSPRWRRPQRDKRYASLHIERSGQIRLPFEKSAWAKRSQCHSIR